MGFVEGGTIEDLAENEILISFEFESKGTKKSLAEILEARNLKKDSLGKICQQRADFMIEKRYLHKDKGGVYVFSKDKDEKYYWKPVSFTDKLMNYIKK
ncbi:MAG: hypothetical protein AABX61_03135 [Nanoarchaeota archaeon]